MKEGGDKFDVSILSQHNKHVTDHEVRDNNDGTYTVRYSLPDSGDYKIDVSVYGDRISNSPFSVTASEGREDFASFTFIAKTDDGKDPITSSVKNFEVDVIGPGTRKIEDFRTVDVNPKIGKYGVDFVPSYGPGIYKIHVKLDGKEIKKSPFILNLGGEAEDEANKLPLAKYPFLAKRKDGTPIPNAKGSRFLLSPFPVPERLLFSLQRRTLT